MARGVPAERQEKVAVAALADLLEQKLKPSPIPGVARRDGAAYGGLDESEQHDLVTVAVPVDERYLDCVSDAGVELVSLAGSYRATPTARQWRARTANPSGWQRGRPGVACRSAATGARAADEELASFDRVGRPGPRPTARVEFSDWWWRERA